MLQTSFNKNTHVFVSVFKELDVDLTILDINFKKYKISSLFSSLYVFKGVQRGFLFLICLPLYTVEMFSFNCIISGFH